MKLLPCSLKEAKSWELRDLRAERLETQRLRAPGIDCVYYVIYDIMYYITHHNVIIVASSLKSSLSGHLMLCLFHSSMYPIHHQPRKNEVSTAMFFFNHQRAAGAEKIQVLRHFQHFPASACASKRVLLQGFELPQSENLEDFQWSFSDFGWILLILGGFPRFPKESHNFRKDVSLSASLEPIDFLGISWFPWVS